MAAEFPETTLQTFRSITKDPEKFLSADSVLTGCLKENLKIVYDYSKSEEIKAKKSNTLPELIIKNFDLEQIWQQIELQNDEILSRSVVNVSKFLVAKDKLIFKNLENEINNSSAQNEVDNKKDNSDELGFYKNDESDDNSDSEESYKADDIEENSSDSDSDQNEKPDILKKPLKPSKVDDDFFKLSEMEQFLNAEEKKLADPDSGNDSESDLKSEGSIDLFDTANIDDGSEDEAKVAKFKDYFVEKTKDLTDKTSNKRNRFLQELDDSEETEQKSSLELRQERLKRKIDELEERAVDEKPWTLKGEITAESRPQNSLLEEVVEFDLTTRPAPVITEQTTLQLEDIIRQRIKDKVFDSVERKIKPIETPTEYKKKLVLDQEKSKHSLAQIYEKEFLDQKEALEAENADKEAEEPQLHKEVKTMMRELFSKLDALSNFHFTPKAAVPELKIISNLPAISMEEVAPISASDAVLLAPEEVRDKPKGDILGKGEKTKTDRKRERRKKKKKQKLHLLEKEKREKLKSKVNVGVPKKYKDTSKTKSSNSKKIYNNKKNK